MRTTLALCLLVAGSAADLQGQAPLDVARGDPARVEGSLLIGGGTLIDGTGRPPMENVGVYRHLHVAGT